MTSLPLKLSTVVASHFTSCFLSCSVHFSCSVVSDSLRPHESQHARRSCPSLTPGVHSDSRSSSRWCHPAISSSVIPFSFCPQSLPASGSFPVSQLFTWGGQSTGVSASASFLPRNTQGFRMNWLDLSCGHMLSHKEPHSVALTSIRACDFYLDNLFGFDFNLITEFIFSSRRVSGLEWPLKL